MSEEIFKIGDLKPLVDEFDKQISEIDQLATAVLKTHFLIEEFIDLILEEVARNPQHLELERPFIQKVKWIRAFAPMGDDERWQLILAINTLRNKVAHKFDGPERKAALQNLRKELICCIFNEQEWRDYDLILAAATESRLFLVEIRNQIGK